MRILFLSASDHTEPHIGCKLVDEAFAYLFKRHGMEVVDWVYKQDLGYSEKHRRFHTLKEWHKDHPHCEFDLVVVNAEGTTHHDHWPELVQVAEDFPAVLINAVWQHNTYTDLLRHFLYTSARESLSAEQMLPTTRVVPDVCFVAPSLRAVERAEIPSGELLTCVVTSRMGMHKTWHPDVLMRDPEFLEKVAGCSRLITGRFHGACIAVSLGVPFTAWPSNTHKIQGLMYDMGVLQNYYLARKEAMAAMPARFSRAAHYVCQAPYRIDRMFQDIKDAAHNAGISSPADASETDQPPMGTGSDL